MHTTYNVSSGNVKHKSNLRRLASRLSVSIFASAAAIGIVAPTALAATNVVVTDSSPKGWVKTGVNGGTINYVASAGATGTGAAEFTTPTDPSYTRLKKTVDVNVASITNLSYDTKQVSAPDSAKTTADVNLRLYISTTGGSGSCGAGFDDVLVYEPYYNNVEQVITPSNWQTWTTSQSNGYWWSNCGVTYSGHVPVPGAAGGYDTNFKLSDVVAQYPSAKVVSLGLGTGDFNSPWVVQADNLVLNTTAYNFENETSRVVVTSKDQCKDNGWKNVTDANGHTFKNQGDCVSFVATHGKNKASGLPTF